MALLDRIKALFTDHDDGDDKAGGTQTDAQAPAPHGRPPQHDMEPRHQPPAPVERSLFTRIAEGLRGVAGDSRRSEDRQGERHGTSALDAIFGRGRAAQGASRGISGASPFGSSGEKYREFRLTGATDFSGETHSRGSSLLGGRRDENRARDRGLSGSTLFGGADKPDDDTDNRLF